jgi:multicomponent K+:H+ antiporter subunit G
MATSLIEGRGMPLWIEISVSLFLLVGSLFILIGAIGLYRLPDFFTRLHGPTKATTLGVGGVIIASTVHFSSLESGLSLHEMLIALFLFITAPVSAHMLAKAAMQKKVKLYERTRGQPWES